jgi:hypothetical protein
MAKPYSNDLRERAVAAIESGHTREEVAEVYNLALSTVGGFISQASLKLRQRTIGLFRYELPDQISMRCKHKCLVVAEFGRADTACFALGGDVLPILFSRVDTLFLNGSLRWRRKRKIADWLTFTFSFAREALLKAQPTLDPKRLTFIGLSDQVKHFLAFLSHLSTFRPQLTADQLPSRE